MEYNDNIIDAERERHGGGMILLVIVIAIIIAALALSLYTVDQTEQAVVTQFGDPVKVVINPIEGKRKDEIPSNLYDPPKHNDATQESQERDDVNRNGERRNCGKRDKPWDKDQNERKHQKRKTLQ